MILVVDSGSYKSDWMFQSKEGELLTLRSSGINPFFTKEKEMVNSISQIKELKPYFSEIQELYFFGSGCTSPDRREIVSNALSNVFSNAFISIDNDIIGSAYATCGKKEGLVATLGTGSSISFFDGKSVLLGKQGLGFVLGDVGSGAWYGKKLVTSFLYGSMPEDLALDFELDYALTKDIVIENVYQKNNPNVYLASFAPFLSKHKNHSYVLMLLRRGFDDFMESNVCLYPDYKQHICHFVGSIAYHFSDVLKEACVKYDVQVGQIIKQPIQNLYEYIVEREKQSLNH